MTDACIFCRIAAKESPAEIEYEDDEVMAFRDLYPKAPVHLLIIPKRHIASIARMEPRDERLVGQCLRVARLMGTDLTVLGLSAASAFAGECPADQQKADVRKPVDVEAVGKTDTVIAMLDVAKEHGIDGRVFRMRRLTIEPGGVVPWHSHGERPAIIYIVEGQIEEYASNCAVPIVHKAGEVVAETKDVSHWWKNTGDQTVVLLSADLLKDPTDKNM